MKKLMSLAMSISLGASLTINVISCNIGDFTSREYLESFEDFDWSKGQTDDGDSYNWMYDDFKGNLDNKNLSLEEISAGQGPVDKIFNYDKYSTSYKGYNSIRKQATTGSPLIKSYRPNGNQWVDFGYNSRSRKYNYINKLVDWNDGTDMDIPYNTSTVELRDRNYVAKKTLKTQQTKTFFNMFHDPSNSSSSIIGTKNPFGGNLTNLNYTHQSYTWPAITNKGWLTSAFADYSEYLHKSGVPVLGLWYMSGWEDLTRESVRTILENDKDGYLKIVDVLIEQCQKLGFDGWFINNEANGSQGDGYVISNEEMNKIMSQFREKAKSFEEKTGKVLRIFYYTNDASLEYDEYTNKPKSKKSLEAAKNADGMQLDFSTRSLNLDSYIKRERDNDNEARKNIYNLYNESVAIPSVGTYDYENMIFPWSKDSGYDTENPSSSFALFGSGAANEFAKSFRNWVNSKPFLTKENEYKYLLMEQEISNLYSIYQMTGKNSYLSEESKGINEMISQGTQNIDEIYQTDPRIKSSEFDKTEITSPKKQFFEINKDNGLYEFGVGVGKNFLEKTVIADKVIENDYSDYGDTNIKDVEKDNDPSLTTYFSTGSGIYFVNRDEDGKLLYNQTFPWSNSRLGDVNPTYQWDFFTKPIGDSCGGETLKITTNDGSKCVTKITDKGQLSPYYDYYNPYVKGNSISIGMGYDFDDGGKVIEPTWDTSQKYFWNLMGTNLSKNNYKVSYYVKKSSSDKSFNNKLTSDEINITYTDSKDNSSPNVITTNVEEINDGWYKISADLSTLNSINSENRIAKLGLNINPKDEKFLLSVGCFKIENKESNIDNTESKIKKINNEYVVKRDSEKYNTNIRFNWETEGNEADYYNLFYSNNLISWYKLGQTTMKRHYIHELDENENQYIYIGVQAVDKNGVPGKIYYSKINTSYNYE
ncbi:hypothetical protein SLITO_v1c07200 [Spiroplasma litorale]|uniref:Cytosolic endo-beta-N-acetylglucosaminidase TIM barrel domain-containing protein n=1 Tax=Spiroplasma litorale TaxID=216942 RepID=A0A0K1W202_9MOLU|nr:hypothetical protein [Spiroplasma litorale]AKX34345.1 hypothetical protein SLITO_v1c07200 [Spiroplasma litorale]